MGGLGFGVPVLFVFGVRTPLQVDIGFLWQLFWAL